MTRIAVTQRVQDVPGRAERRDCLDQRWVALLEPLGATVVPVPNTLADPAGWLQAVGANALILTGGNDLAHLDGAVDTAPERDGTERALLDHAAAVRLPVLAVCRGLQLLNVHCGGQLARSGGHAGARHPVRWLDGSDVQDVNSYHDWGIDPAGVATALEVLAVDEEERVEAVRHRDLPWVGVMWHPEREQRLSERDGAMIRDLVTPS